MTSSLAEGTTVANVYLNSWLNAAIAGTELKKLPYGTFMPDSGKQSRRDKTAEQEPGGASSDERLLEAASRNPSLAGRDLLTEILARGPEPEEAERPRATDVRAALQSRNLDDPDYRTAAEQADWLGKESQEMRDLYERGAVIKGETLVIPAEGHELREQDDRPFITSFSYAQEHLPLPDHAAEFHALGRAIAGEMADTRGEIETFRFYYDRVNRDQSGRRLRQDQTTEREAAVTRTLAEMRAMADVMRQLETQHSIEVTQPVGSLEQVRDVRSAQDGVDEERNAMPDDWFSRDGEETGGVQHEGESGRYNLEEQVAPDDGKEIDAASYGMNTSARKVRLDAESLRLPAGLSFEAKQRLVAQTLPAIDRKLESGTSREVIFAAVDGHQRKLNEASQGGLEERDEWFKVGGFIKAYVDERLRDPETRELTRSPEFRAAHAQISAARTPKELSRAAERFLRENSERSQALRRHREEPDQYPVPKPLALDARQRQLLFYGRSPEHFSPEMRELKFNWGLSRDERAAQAQLLREGQLEPSPTLKLMLRELESRHSVKAVAHYQAAILNEKLENPGKLNLHSLHESLAPHERNYLFDRMQERKQTLVRSALPGQRMGADDAARDANTVLAATNRAFGQLPGASGAYRDYMAAMGTVERQLLNEAVRRRGITAGDERLVGELRPLSITEARAMLPVQEQTELRRRARNLAWEFVAPPEVFARNPSPAALRLSDAIAYTQEHLQERARTAHAAREQFIRDQVTPAEKRLAEKRGRAAYLESFSARLQELKRELPEHGDLKSAGAVSLQEEIAAQRQSTSFDPQDVPIGLRQEVKSSNDPANSRKLMEEYANREVDLAEQAHQAGLAAMSETRKRPLFDSREEQERFTQEVLAKLAPADAHKLAELDAYAVKTREELYRGFEAMDDLRRDLEQSRSLQPSDFTQATSELPRELESMAVASPHLTIAEQLKAEAKDLAGKARTQASDSEQRLGYVDSTREWHCESLRDVLGSNQHGDGQDAPEIATFHREQRDIEFER
jgi:hypothetical protein